MIKVRVEVLDQTGCFTVAVYAENLRQATQIAEDRYPGSGVRIPFPIEPDNFFTSKPSRDGHVEFEGAGEARRASENIVKVALPRGTDCSLCTEPSPGV